MNFSDLNRQNIMEIVNQRLDEIEQKESVKILLAVESGSRAWGFSSPDSDYDVRFIYVRKEAYYLELQEKKDFIDWELNKVLDINGWDISKVLQHIHKSNATVFEWLNSPIVYRSTAEYEQLKEVSKFYFSCKSAMHHYYGTAKKNYLAYLQEDFVKYKKYFYVLRPILACKWIEERKCPPPVLFTDLMNTVLEPEMQTAVQQLVKQKVQMIEREKGKRVDVINDYISKKLDYYSVLLQTMENDRNADWNKVNQTFLNILNRHAL